MNIFIDLKGNDFSDFIVFFPRRSLRRLWCLRRCIIWKSMYALNLSFIYVHCEMIPQIICAVHVVLYEYLCTIWIEVFQFVEFFINIWLTICMFNLLDFLLHMYHYQILMNWQFKDLLFYYCRWCTCSFVHVFLLSIYIRCWCNDDLKTLILDGVQS